MILNTIKINEIEKIGDNISNGKMHLAIGAEAHLIRMLTRAYSDPIGSLIREASANGIDSMRMANKDEPTICRLQRDNSGNFLFEIEDKGLGLNEEEFYKYIMGVGESTKQNIPGVIGGYGIGSKSALSYTNTFYYTCVKNGIERKFVIYSGEVVPEADLVHQKETINENGVTVTVPIKNGDYRTFLSKIKEQLSYFGTLYFDIPDFNNNFKIFKEVDFQWSEMSTDKFMCITLDDVYYPLDYSKLNINHINIPIALKFSLSDNVIPIPNREQLEYTTETTKLILDKIKKVANYFVSKYNENVSEFETFLKAYDYLGNSTHFIEIEGSTFCINDLEQYSDISVQEVKIKGLEKRNGNYYKKKSEELIWEYSPIAYDERGTWRRQHLSWELKRKAFSNSKIVIFNGSLTGNIKEFLRKKCGVNTLYIERQRERELKKTLSGWGNTLSDSCYISLLGLANKDKSKWRGLIQEWQFVRDQVIARFPDESDLENTIEYKEFLKDKKSRMQELRRQGVRVNGYIPLGKIKGDITIGRLRGKRYDSSLTADKTVGKIEELYKTPRVTVYFTKDEFNADSRIVFKYYKAFKSKVDFVILNQREIKFVTPHHQFKNFKEFNMSKSFSRVSAAIRINEMLKQIPSDRKNYILEFFPKWTDTYTKLRAYVREHIGNSDISNDIKDVILEEAEKNNNFDTFIEADYLEMKEVVKMFYWLPLVQDDTYYDTAELKKAKKKLVASMLLFQKRNLDDYELCLKVPNEELEKSYQLEQEIFSNVDELIEEPTYF